ncbi:unnamed protein product, partial [Amoebophrya sp. A120]
ARATTRRRHRPRENRKRKASPPRTFAKVSPGEKGEQRSGGAAEKPAPSPPARKARQKWRPAWRRRAIGRGALSISSLGFIRGAPRLVATWLDIRDRLDHWGPTAQTCASRLAQVGRPVWSTALATPVSACRAAAASLQAHHYRDGPAARSRPRGWRSRRCLRGDAVAGSGLRMARGLRRTYSPRHVMEAAN